MKIGCKIAGWVVGFAMAGAVHAGPIACPANSNPACLPGFPLEFSGAGVPPDVGGVVYASPAVARLGLVADNYKDIVIGTSNGYVLAYHANGSFLWAYKTGSIPVNSKPAIADIDGDGVLEVVVSAGMGGMAGGGVYVLRNNGTLKCAFTALDPAYGGWGIWSSPALARLDPTRPNEMQAVFGGFDMHIRAMRPDCSLYWDKDRDDLVVDTVWSSPAIYDLDRDGQLDVVIGEDSNAVVINGVPTPDGGIVRAFRGNGNGELPGFPIMLDEVVFSSPAIGYLDNSGLPSLVVGNGRCWDFTACTSNPHAVTEATFAWRGNATVLPGWPYAMPQQSARTASPALADLDNDGKPEVVINTLVKTAVPATNDVNGYVHVIRADGTAYPGWPVQPNLAKTCSEDVHYGSTTSPVVVDLTGDGVPEIVMSNGVEVMVWDSHGNQLSRTHVDACANPNPAVLALLTPGGAFGTPVAADLFGDGRISLVVGSTAPGSNPARGALYAWKFPNSIASERNMPWPEFRHDMRNNGVYIGDTIFRNGFDAAP